MNGEARGGPGAFGDGPRGPVRHGWRGLLPFRDEAAGRRAAWTDLAVAVLLAVLAVYVGSEYPEGWPVSVKQDVHDPLMGPPQGPSMGPPPGLEEEHWPPLVLWPLELLSTLPLAVRRRYPLAAFAVVAGATVAISEYDSTWINVLSCVLGAYSAVVHSRHRVRAAGLLVLASVFAGRAFRDSAPLLPGWSSPGVVLLVTGVLAGLVRFWRRELINSRHRYDRLRRDQEEATRRAVAEERSRIAAELHDVVTHNVSVMVIQAGAARTVLESAPEQSRQALLAVEAGGRAAMAELRHVMGLLTAPDHERPDGFEPQPGLDRLDVLVERVRAAGTPVRVAVSLPGEPLPPGVDLAAYRVVQEALTNAIRHAPGAEASVTVGHTADHLTIEVTNSGAVREASGVGGNGRGLIGLRERLAVYGGDLTAGPTRAGGYQVTARIPRRTP